MAPEGLPDPLRIALIVARIFERLGVSYVTAGSFASSLHGEPRSTDDVDVVADLRPAHAAGLGILRAQGARLDRAELATWAKRLDVTDLLLRALAEAGVSSG